jgi:DNA-binding IclR family transcriptional regulator
MSKPHISEELKTFIKDKIQTVLRLEVLLLLHDQQFRSFTADEIAKEMGFGTEATQRELTALEAIGLVAQSSVDESKYKYQPANETLGSTVKRLATAYSTQRVPILSVILAQTSDRPRLFAEAFRIIRRE